MYNFDFENACRNALGEKVQNFFAATRQLHTVPPLCLFTTTQLNKICQYTYVHASIIRMNDNVTEYPVCMRLHECIRGKLLA